MIAEDVDINREIIDALLEPTGISIDFALDGEDGTQRDLRKLIPIIAMTANVFREDVERCLAAGMNGHLGKPVEMDKVISTLSRYLT
jgi:CheY-like chemotaxis protein